MSSFEVFWGLGGLWEKLVVVCDFWSGNKKIELLPPSMLSGLVVPKFARGGGP